MRRTALFFSAVAVIAVTACGKDSATTEPPPPPDGTSSSGQNIALDTTQVDADTLVVGDTVQVRVVVALKGVPVSNTPVSWTITSGHGTVSKDTTLTDANGLASVTWVLGDTAGINSVAAGIPGASVTLSKFTIAGPPVSLRKLTQDSSSVVAGATFPLTARVVDKTGNPAKGATITWTTTGGDLSTASVTTSESGNASTNLVTSAAGTYFVTATLAGKATVTFKVVAF